MIGLRVRIEPKSEQGTGNLVEGCVKEILTPGISHPYGIMVILDNGVKGRIKQIANNDGTFDLNIVNESYSAIKSLPHIPKFEDTFTEFKATFQSDLEEERLRFEGNLEAANGRKNNEKQIKDELKKEISISISALANKEGGQIFIGINDNGEVIGLKNDLMFYGNKDKLSRAITESIKNYLKNLSFIATLQMSFHEIHDKLVCHIKVPAATEPIYVDNMKSQDPYVRMDGRSEKFGMADFLKYSKIRFPNL